MTRAPGSLAGGFLVAVVGCALVAVVAVVVVVVVVVVFLRSFDKRLRLLWSLMDVSPFHLQNGHRPN